MVKTKLDLVSINFTLIFLFLVPITHCSTAEHCTLPPFLLFLPLILLLYLSLNPASCTALLTTLTHVMVLINWSGQCCMLYSFKTLCGITKFTSAEENYADFQIALAYITF